MVLIKIPNPGRLQTKYRSHILRSTHQPKTGRLHQISKTTQGKMIRMRILIILHHIHRIPIVNVLQSRHLNINQSLSPAYVCDALHLIQRMQNMLHHVRINHQIRREIQSQIFQHTNPQIQAMNISTVGHVFRTQINSYHGMTFTSKKI